MMNSRLRITTLLCGLLLVVQGCGTPAIERGKVVVIVTGSGHLVRNFAEEAGKRNPCRRIGPPWEASEDPKHPDADLTQLVYRCEDEMLQGANRPAGQFGDIYAKVIAEGKFDRGRSLQKSDTGSSEGKGEAEGGGLQMRMTNNAACYINSCGGSTPLFWRMPCALRC